MRAGDLSGMLRSVAATSSRSPWQRKVARADDMMVVDDQLIECQIPATLTC
jgi:hypothetical protein